MVFIIWVANTYIKEHFEDQHSTGIATATSSIAGNNDVVVSIKNRSNDLNLLILAIIPVLLILIMAYLCLTTLWKMNYMFQTDVLRIRGLFQVASIKAPLPVCFISHGSKRGIAANSNSYSNGDEVVGRLPKGFIKSRDRTLSTPFRGRDASGAVPAQIKGSKGCEDSGRRGGSAQRRRTSTLSRTRAYHR